jgi:hypothetical protein
VATSVLTIEEQTGQKRRLSLKGGGLPFRGASFAGETVVSTTWNNGNPEATQQVLVSKEVPSDWEGQWRTTQLLGTPCEYDGPDGFHHVGLAYELVQLFEQIRIAGQLLRVTWTNEVQRKNNEGGNGALHSHRQTRLGRLTGFDPSYDNLDDIRWKMTFDWVSRGDTTPKSVDFRGEDLIAATRDAIQKQDAVAKAVAQNLLRSLEAQGFRRKNYASTFTLGQLEQIANSPIEMVDSFARTANAVSNRLKKVGDLVLKVRAIPFAIAGRALDVANNAVSVATSFSDNISQKCPEQQMLGTKLSSLTRTASYFSDVQTQSQLMEAANSRLAQQARLRKSELAGQAQPRVNSPKNGDLIAVHLPRDGETMVTISDKYYKADLSAELAKANALPANTIRPPRFPLIIPTRSTLEARGQQST